MVDAGKTLKLAWAAGYVVYLRGIGHTNTCRTSLLILQPVGWFLMRHEALQDIMKQFACMGKQSRARVYEHGVLFTTTS